MRNWQGDSGQLLPLLAGVAEWFRPFPTVVRRRMRKGGLLGVTGRYRKGHGTVRTRYPAHDKGHYQEGGNKNSGFLMTVYLHTDGILFDVIRNFLRTT